MWKTEYQIYVEDWISNISFDIQSSTFNMVFLIWLRYCTYIFFLYMIFCSHDTLQPRETKCETKSLWRISSDHYKVTSLRLNAIQSSPFGIQFYPFGIQSFSIWHTVFPHSAVSLSPFGSQSFPIRQSVFFIWLRYYTAVYSAVTFCFKTNFLLKHKRTFNSLKAEWHYDSVVPRGKQIISILLKLFFEIPHSGYLKSNILRN